jgi:ribosomal-protein-alanine N-acetyltransferase
LLKPDTGEAMPVERGWRRWLRDLLGRAEGSRVIGYVGLRFHSAEAHVSTIAVHPDWRGKGLGELLLLTAIEQARALGSSVLSLEVRASNRVAQALYRKYGFHFGSVHRGYYQDGEDAWLMEVDVRRETYGARLNVLRQALETRLRGQPADVGQNSRDTL